MISVIFFDLGDTLIGENRTWIDGAKSVIETLHARGLRLGIISNTRRLERDQILDLLPPDFDLDLFEESLVLFSSIVGIAKPELGIFLEAVRRADVPPNQCLFCTEALDHTLAAQRAFMRTARLYRPDQLIALVGKRPELTDPRIHRRRRRMISIDCIQHLPAVRLTSLF